ncbi:MAG: T9SS type A sorting domain-containing protein [Bacteroidota bacterium]
MDVSALPKGMYVVRLKKSNGSTVQRLLVE